MTIARALRLPLVASVASLVVGACGTSFTPESLVDSVRLLAISADKPYPAPGDTVSMEALAFDGRAIKPSPMQVFWVPVVCPDPEDDAYFACYPGFDKGFSPGVDLTPLLTAGPRFSFHVPDDIITAHARPASGVAYGTVVVFAIACAGHVELVPPTADTSPPAPPLGCFDDTGAELSPADSVFAYAQVFSFADGRTNANPVIDGLTLAGAAVDPAKGITVDACPSTGRCATVALDTVVPSSSQELDPGDLSASGTPLHEEIWVDYYLTAGAVGGPALLYDATAGKVTKSAVQLTPPSTAGDQLLWAVVHDNRGGVSWLEVPLHAQ